MSSAFYCGNYGSRRFDSTVVVSFRFKFVTDRPIPYLWWSWSSNYTSIPLCSASESAAIRPRRIQMLPGQLPSRHRTAGGSANYLELDTAFGSLFASEVLWRSRLVNDETLLWHERVQKPLIAFELLCLQATNTQHCPWSEPSQRARIVAAEQRLRIGMAAHFIKLRIGWEEGWGRLSVLAADSFIRRLWAPSRLMLALEEQREWSTLAYCAEPFLDDVKEARLDYDRLRTARHNRLQWLEALREKASEDRARLEAHRAEVVLMGKMEQWDSPLRNMHVATGTAAFGQERSFSSSPVSRVTGTNAQPLIGGGVAGFEAHLRRSEDAMWGVHRPIAGGAANGGAPEHHSHAAVPFSARAPYHQRHHPVGNEHLLTDGGRSSPTFGSSSHYRAAVGVSGGGGIGPDSDDSATRLASMQVPLRARSTSQQRHDRYY